MTEKNNWHDWVMNILTALIVQIQITKASSPPTLLTIHLTSQKPISFVTKRQLFSTTKTLGGHNSVSDNSQIIFTTNSLQDYL